MVVQLAHEFIQRSPTLQQKRYRFIYRDINVSWLHLCSLTTVSLDQRINHVGLSQSIRTLPLVGHCFGL